MEARDDATCFVTGCPQDNPTWRTRNENNKPKIGLDALRVMCVCVRVWLFLR